MTMLEDALALAEAGAHVFPCKPRGKMPLIPKSDGGNGHHDATTDPEQITDWWTQCPKANIGIACKTSGWLVLDIDRDHKDGNGAETLSDIEAELGFLPKTSEVKTGNGFHLYFKDPGVAPPAEMGPGLHVKYNGYVISPPSIHPDGEQYAWVQRGNPVELPKPWVKRLKKGKPRNAATATPEQTSQDGAEILKEACESLANCKKGSRNDTLNKTAYWIAQHVAGGAIQEGPAKKAIRKAAEDCGLEEKEIQRTAKSGWDAGLKKPRKVASALPRFTDLGNADRFVAMFEADFMYCHLWRKWLFWDSVRWRVDDSLRVIERAKRIPRQLFDEAQETMNGDLAKWAAKSQDRPRIESMVSLARSSLPTWPDVLDKRPLLLNARNGTVDLTTGELRAADRADLMTTMAPVQYDPAATCPTWDSFLNHIMGGDQDLVDYLRRAVGYSLTGSVEEQCMFFLYGKGANGKTTFLEALLGILGDNYSLTAPPNLLMARKHEEHATEIAKLHGARLVSTVEVAEGHFFNEVKLKQLTGQDKLTARRMREDFWSFEPTHKIWLAANHKPGIVGTDLAIWRRIRLVPFNVTIPKNERDSKLPDKLRAEYQGIMAWAVRGCLEWRQHGLQDPPGVLAAVEEYRLEMDLVARFIDEKCFEGAGVEDGAAELYDAYKGWAADNQSTKAFTKTDFGKKLEARGYSKRKGAKGKRMWVGVCLSAPLPGMGGACGTGSGVSPIRAHIGRDREVAPPAPPRAKNATSGEGGAP